MFRDLGQRLTLSFGRRLTRVAVSGVVTICAAVSLAPSAASSATNPKPNKDVICSSIVKPSHQVSNSSVKSISTTDPL